MRDVVKAVGEGTAVKVGLAPRQALVMLLAAVALSGCSEERSKDKYELIELLRVEGTCFEDYIRLPAAYAGELVLWRNITRQQDMRYGHVLHRGDVVADTVREAENPAKYLPPFAIEFRDLTGKDIVGDALHLPGVSSHVDQSKSYESTCDLKVVARSNEVPIARR